MFTWYGFPFLTSKKNPVIDSWFIEMFLCLKEHKVKYFIHLILITYIAAIGRNQRLLYVAFCTDILDDDMFE